MDIATISAFKELGIAIVAVLSTGYIAYLLIKELRSNREDYTRFVIENNHEKTAMIEKHTETMVEVKNSIQTNTEVVRMLIKDK